MPYVITKLFKKPTNKGATPDYTKSYYMGVTEMPIGPAPSFTNKKEEAERFKTKSAAQKIAKQLGELTEVMPVLD